MNAWARSSSCCALAVVPRPCCPQGGKEELEKCQPEASAPRWTMQKNPRQRRHGKRANRREPPQSTSVSCPALLWHVATAQGLAPFSEPRLARKARARFPSHALLPSSSHWSHARAARAGAAAPRMVTHSARHLRRMTLLRVLLGRHQEKKRTRLRWGTVLRPMLRSTLRTSHHYLRFHRTATSPAHSLQSCTVAWRICRCRCLHLWLLGWRTLAIVFLLPSQVLHVFLWFSRVSKILWIPQPGFWRRVVSPWLLAAVTRWCTNYEYVALSCESSILLWGAWLIDNLTSLALVDWAQLHNQKLQDSWRSLVLTFACADFLWY